MNTSEWINTLLSQLSKLDSNELTEAVSLCGEECSKGSHLLKGAAEIRHQYENISDTHKILDAFKVKYYNTPNLVKEGSQIVLIFDSCTCFMVKEGVNNPYLCSCTIGYTKRVFETLFGKPVSVKLEQSILKGDKRCRQTISICE